jgi:hypothetical protein
VDEGGNEQTVQPARKKKASKTKASEKEKSYERGFKEKRESQKITAT